MEREKYYEKVLSWEELSFEDKLEVISSLVSKKTFQAIMDNAVLSKATWEEIGFKVSRSGSWSDEQDIKRVLKLLGARSYEVESKSHSCTDIWGEQITMWIHILTLNFNLFTMNQYEMLVKSLAGERLSPEERIELSNGLVSEKTQSILTKEFLIAQHWTKGKVQLTLMARECRDPDENIRKFLETLGCKKISVTSDFPAYCESYEWSTKIKFRV